MNTRRKGRLLTPKCAHLNVTCLNHYDLIRKYRCEDCRGVMMCACDRAVGEKHLPHQLAFGRKYDSREEFKVTLGFQPSICDECRGLPPPNYPMAAIYGHTSKIRRYYWREIEFEVMRRLNDGYLWAHRPQSVATARKIKGVLGLDNLRKVLTYLTLDYWRHYLGWPDLLVFKPGQFFFVEVKSSGDRLSEDQKRWILDNQQYLKFGFKVFKISAPSKQVRTG